MEFLILLLVIAVGVASWATRLYNGLRTRSEAVKRSQSNLAGELKKRATLANQLIDDLRDMASASMTSEIARARPGAGQSRTEAVAPADRPRRTLLPDVMAAAFAIALAASAAAQSFTPAEGGGFRERVDASRPVSASSVLVGLGVADSRLLAARQRPRRHLWILCLGNCAGRIEVEATSASGRYEGRGRFDGAATHGTWVRLPLDPPSRSVLAARQNLPDDQLATIAWPIDARGRRIERPMVTAWTESDVPPSGDMLLIAVGGQDDMWLRAGSGRAIPCLPTSGRSFTAFAKVCQLPLANLPADGRMAIVRREGTGERVIPLRLQ